MGQLKKIVFGTDYYLSILQNSSNESPFKAIEELARQAIEAAAGEEAADSPEKLDQSAAASPPAKEQVTN